MSAHTIVIHNLAQAEAALIAARGLGRSVTLTSAVGAIGYLGPLTFLKIVDAASTAVPEARFETVVNCGDEPGLALAALRHGATRIAIDIGTTATERLADIARQQGATILPPPVNELDLDGCKTPHKMASAYLTETADYV